MKPGALIIEAKKALDNCKEARVQPAMWLMNNKMWEKYCKSSLFTELKVAGVHQCYTMLNLTVTHVRTDKLMHFNGFLTEMILITTVE